MLGLKSVFAALMGKIKATAKRKLTAEEKRDEEARATSLLGSLFMVRAVCLTTEHASFHPMLASGEDGGL